MEAIAETTRPADLPPGAMIPTKYLPGTLDDYFALEARGERRYEFHGVNRIVAMAGGTPAHMRIASNFSREVGTRIGSGRCEAFSDGARVKVQRTGKHFYPDTTAACGGSEFVKEKGQFSLVNPVLVVEVISPSTEQVDRREKFNEYFLIDSLREYVVAEQDEARVTVFGRDAAGQRRFEVIVGLDATVKLASLGIEIPMRELYRNVVFSPVPPTAPDDEVPTA